MASARILIVEDDRVVARDIAQQLVRCGHAIAGSVASGEEAIAVAAQAPLDLVLMDVRLEGNLDGIDTARRLREAHGLPVVFLTAYADEETVRRATVTEPFGYVLKPFEDQQLRTVVEMALYKHGAERRLRDSEHRYAVTLASIGDGVIATDCESRITLINPVAEALTGWSREEAAGRPLAEVLVLIDEDTNVPLGDRGTAVLGRQAPVDLPLRTRLVGRHGREAPVEARGTPIVDDVGQVVGAVLAIRDVTQTRRAAQAEILRATNARLDAAMQGSNVGVWDLELDGEDERHWVLRCWNAHEWLGYGEHAGAPSFERFMELVHPDDLNRFGEAFRNQAESGGALAIEHRLLHRDGSYRWVLTRGAPRRHADGAAVCLSGTLIDITALKRAEQALRVARDEAEAANKAKDEFLANISHELRTPLNGILGYAQVLRHDDTLVPRHRSHVAVIEQSGTHLLTLINDLLEFARIGAGQTELQLADVLLAPFLEMLADMVAVRAREKGLTQTRVIARCLPAVIRVDEKRLRQVLLNLLSNAVKFTDEGEVTFAVRQISPGLLRFEVSDTGVGITRDQLERVFRPFEQAGDTERRSAGVGLGLSISQQLVWLMGSEIHVESELGRGSRFWFDLAVQVPGDSVCAACGADGTGSQDIDTAAHEPAAGTSMPLPSVPVGLGTGAPLAVPLHEDMEILHRLALRGQMRDVMRHANALLESDGRYQAFVLRVRRLAENFESRELLAFIERHWNGREPA
ncbi:hybrid sensor histidine kinase/response regulator [Paraburkholderia heleia]|uniref:hybrid sensor histidine kinase/response regulator n=1 Tax=Paraburkholderia heleia TaxID=634127 RepID=UPI000693A9F3|nr:ATP-binding protein [Paraburkholderia heleia]